MHRSFRSPFRSLRSTFAVALTALPLAIGCSAGVDEDPPGVMPIPEDGVKVPFTVSTYFAPSGFMGDGADGVSLTADNGGSACAPRPDGADGDCYRFTYKPSAQLWAGVYLQFPSNNWGAAEGMKVAPGAKQVSFWAAGGAGGETLKVTIGGVKDPILPYADTLKAAADFKLTKDMTQYTVPLTGQTYDKVIGAFSWVVAMPPGTNPAGAAPVVVYIDDLVWE